MEKSLPVSFAMWLLLWAPQILGQTQDERIATKSETSVDGHLLFKVENRSSQPITAMVVVENRTPRASSGNAGTSVRYFDSVVNSHIRRYQDLMPHQTYTFTLSGRDPTQVQRDVSLKAALFADGSSYGDAEWVNRLIVGRRAMLMYLDEGIKMLQLAKADGQTRDEVVSQAETVKKTRESSNLTAEEKMAARQVYGDIAWSLKSDAIPLGDQLTVSQRIEELIARFLQEEQALERSKPSLKDIGTAGSGGN